MDIKGSSIVVTGGASGLGAATVEMIVAQGGKAVIADMNEELGLALAERLGDAAKFTLCDVSNEEHAQKRLIWRSLNSVAYTVSSIVRGLPSAKKQSAKTDLIDSIHSPE